MELEFYAFERLDNPNHFYGYNYHDTRGITKNTRLYQSLGHARLAWSNSWNLGRQWYADVEPMYRMVKITMQGVTVEPVA